MRQSEASSDLTNKQRNSEKTFDNGAGKSSFALTFSRKTGVDCLPIQVEKTSHSVARERGGSLAVLAPAHSLLM